MGVGVPVGPAGRPAQRGPEVVGHGVEPRPPLAAAGGGVLGVGEGLGRRQAPPQVAVAGGVELAGVGQPFGPVLADGLQRPVPGAPGGGGGGQQTLVRQPGQPGHDLVRAEGIEPGDLDGGRRRER